MEQNGEKYLKLTVEELAQDPDFISWIKQNKKHSFWSALIDNNQAFKQKAIEAKQLILIFEDKKDEISERETRQLWAEIKNNETYYKKLNTKQKINQLLKYAAVFVIILSATYAIYTTQKPKEYTFTSTSDLRNSTEAYIRLATGAEVPLQTDESQLVLNNNTLKINNDSIIDLQKTEKKKEQYSMNEVVVPYGKKSQLTLPDGTKVWLNAGSRFAFPSVFYGKKRKVILEGEAYFEVSHNIKEPFIVETQNIDIKVLGTKFNLTAYSNSQKTETVLLEGKISLKNKSQINRFSKDLILKPGQLASYSTDNKNIKIVELNDPDIYIAWTKGWFLFKHENLGNILNKLERYYNISFVYDNSIENNAVLSGKLDLKDSLNNVLEALSDVCKVNFTRNNGVIFVKNNDKK